ncbi:MAG: hypothetical protein JNK99_15575 [Candidatus Accumulibacter sp.]|uniref:phage fiber-tail adaptor protein n=1 Tax=Accumulibacter sp. TaxID=2053492 RepID=UPI001A5DF2BB|nr:hypothetical protein [Accumulibacter sp.]MBL8396140.1 hypothetical protein [Accumulibacter sp.]
MSTTWPAKDPAEKLICSFDFSPELDSGETIDHATLSVTLLSGGDANPSALLDGAPQIAGGSVVLHAFQGGVDGANYRFRCLATLSSGRILALAATLPVRTA